MPRFFLDKQSDDAFVPMRSNLMEKIIEASLKDADKGTVPLEKMLTRVDHTQIEIVSGSEEIYQLVVNAIKAAKKQILIQTFVWMPETQVVKDIKEALCSLDKEVDVFLLLDQLGPLARVFFLGEIPPIWPEHTPASLGLDGLPENIRLHVGIYTHNGLASNHNKTILVDDNLIVTGANFQIENYGPKPFHDAAMYIPHAGAEFAFCDFKTMWEQRTNPFEEPGVVPLMPEIIRGQSANYCPMLYVTSTCNSWPAVLPLYQATLPASPLNNAYLAAINHATRVIRIASPNVNSPEIMEALADFINAREGCVELLLGKGFNELREKVYGRTNQSSVNLFKSMIDEDKQENLQIRWYDRGEGDEYNKTPDIIHMKFMAIDDHVVIYGSANLDFISLNNTHEGNIVIDSQVFTQRAIATLFAPVFKKAIPALIEENWPCNIL
jgi:cardiolipin synthase A/B